MGMKTVYHILIILIEIGTLLTKVVHQI